MMKLKLSDNIVLYKKLSEMPQVQELHPVPDAHAPVMKFQFNDVSVNLLYIFKPLSRIIDNPNLCSLYS